MSMLKDKAKIKELRAKWKMGKDFSELTTGEQARFIWWIITGNPRGLYFVYMQVMFAKEAKITYDMAKEKDKAVIILTLANSGYYKYPPSRC